MIFFGMPDNNFTACLIVIILFYDRLLIGKETNKGV
jgi:hypothetical protein